LKEDTEDFIKAERAATKEKDAAAAAYTEAGEFTKKAKAEKLAADQEYEDAVAAK